MSTEELTNRWHASDIERLGSILVNGGNIDSSALPNLPLVDGRLDLRGVDMPSRGYTPGVTVGASFAPLPPLQTTVKSARFDSVDISYGNLARRLIQNSTFIDVFFLKTNLESVSVHSTRTNMNSAGIGYSGTHYKNCLFRKINFSRTSFGRPEFDDCKFEDCRFNNADLFGSSFERCSFVGKVHDAWFHGHYPSVPGKPFVYDDSVKQFGEARPNKMTNVDFSSAELSWVTFSDDCDLSTCRIPQDDFILKFSKWSEVLCAVKSRVPFMFNPDDGDVAQLVIIFEAHAAAGQHWYIVNFRDFSKYLSMSVIERLKDLFVEEAIKIGALLS
jgi:uncharacterized protein YjbI with pentapeptide repeats